MKKLHTFILKSFLGPLIATFFISLFILVMQFLWKYVDDMVGKGLDWIVLGELMVYASLGMVPMALPLAVLLASLMTFGNLGENYELTALKSAGVSLPKIMAPLIILIIFISFFAFKFANNVLPVSNLKLTSLMIDVKTTKPELDIKEKIFYNQIPDFSIKINKKDKETDLLHGVMIYDHSNHSEKNSNVTIADSGKLQITHDKKFMKLTLFNGVRYDENANVNFKRRYRRSGQTRKEKLSFRTDVFDKQISYLELEGFGFSRSDENLHKNKYKMKNMNQLSTDIDSISKIHTKLSTDLKQKVSTNYFKQTHKKPLKIKEKVLSTDSVSIVNLDSITNTFSTKQKRLVYNVAIRHARQMKQTVEDQSRFITKEDRLVIRHSMEIHRKFTLSFACIVFFFIGAPLGAIIRKGGLGLPVVISVLFFIFYYIINTFGEKLAREGLWETYQGMWLSSFILFFIGVFLTYKSTNDSSLLNTDAYYILIGKILKKKESSQQEEK